VAIDPSFSLAWARLGDLLAAVGNYRESFRAYESALDSGNGERLTKRERDRIKGNFALDSGDFEAAEAAFRDYSSYYENDYLGWFYRGYPLLMLGRTDAAIETLRRAYAIDPSRGYAPLELARTYISTGNLDEALVWANTLTGQGDLGNAAFFQGVVHFLRHQYPEALASFRTEQKEGRSQHHARAYSFIATVYAEQANSAEALKALDRGIQEDTGRGSTARGADKMLAKAFIEVNQGDIAAALADLDHAIALDKSPQRITQASTILGLAIASPTSRNDVALMQRLVDLQNSLDKSDPTIVAQIAREHVQGELFLAHRDYSAAIRELRKAAQLDVRFNGQEALGRALETASLHEHDPAKAAALRQQSAEAYKATATHPEYAWLRTDSNLPGIYRVQLSAYLRMAAQTHENSSSVRSAVCDFQSLTSSQARPFPWTAACGAAGNHSM
jgi:tetratricopeptide (TPR) repeat protein